MDRKISMTVIVEKSLALLNIRQIRFLIAGGFNTIAGYFMIILVHHFLHKYTNMIVVGIIANALSISIAFFTQKVFVFCTKGNWLREYLRCYVVYGISITINVLGLWLLVDIMHISVWWGALIMAIICCVITYIGHSKFTFNG